MGLAVKLFMSGVRPIDFYDPRPLCEQVPTQPRAIEICMAELMRKKEGFRKSEALFCTETDQIAEIRPAPAQNARAPASYLQILLSYVSGTTVTKILAETPSINRISTV